MPPKNKPGLGRDFDPLAAVLGDQAPAATEPAPPPAPAPVPAKPAKPAKAAPAARVRFPIVLPADVVDRLRRAAYHTRLPLSRITREGVEARLAELEAQRGGRPFPPIPGGGSLPKGKPIGS